MPAVDGVNRYQTSRDATAPALVTQGGETVRVETPAATRTFVRLRVQEMP